MNTKPTLKTSNLQDWMELFENLGAFTDNLSDALSTALNDEYSDDFRMSAVEEFTKGTSLTAIFHFKKFSQDSTLYRLCKYEAILTDYTFANSKIRQTFYNLHDSVVTLKEAFNLLQGRYVRTDLYTESGISYNAWIKLNLKEKDGRGDYKVETYRTGTSFDLLRLFSLYPIIELGEPGFAAALVKSLEQGNSEIVTFQLRNKVEKMAISVNPRNQTLSIYPLKSLLNRYTH